MNSTPETATKSVMHGLRFTSETKRLLANQIVPFYFSFGVEEITLAAIDRLSKLILISEYSSHFPLFLRLIRIFLYSRINDDKINPSCFLRDICAVWVLSVDKNLLFNIVKIRIFLFYFFNFGKIDKASREKKNRMVHRFFFLASKETLRIHRKSRNFALFLYFLKTLYLI